MATTSGCYFNERTLGSGLGEQAADSGEVVPCRLGRKVDLDRLGGSPRAGRQRGLEGDEVEMIKAGWIQGSMWALLRDLGAWLCPSQLDRGYGAQGTVESAASYCVWFVAPQPPVQGAGSLAA